MANNTYMTFTILRNAQLANTSFQLVDSSSFVSFDTNGIPVTGGIALYSFIITNNGTQVIDMTPLDVVIVPGETLTLAASSTDTNNSLGIGGFSWIENT